jgi:hypothetical protein
MEWKGKDERGTKMGKDDRSRKSRVTIFVGMDSKGKGRKYNYKVVRK